MLEGHPQICGTQFDAAESEGALRPYLLADPEYVNERRLAIAMNSIEAANQSHYFRAIPSL